MCLKSGQKVAWPKTACLSVSQLASCKLARQFEVIVSSTFGQLYIEQTLTIIIKYKRHLIGIVRMRTRPGLRLEGQCGAPVYWLNMHPLIPLLSVHTSLVSIGAQSTPPSCPDLEFGLSCLCIALFRTWALTYAVKSRIYYLDMFRSHKMAV